MNNLIRTNAKVLHDKEHNFLEIIFSGFITYEELVEVCEYEFKLIEHFSIKKCLINLRHISIYPPGGEEFIKTVWFPKVIKLEIRAIAFIVPDDVFAQVSMEEAHDVKKLPITIKHFTGVDAAKQWLQSE